MELLGIIVIALALGGLIGTGVNILATRLPADIDLLGPPVKPDGGPVAGRWYMPYLGARDPHSGAIDWPSLGTQAGAMIVAGAALGIHDFSLSALQAIVLSSILLAILRIDWQHHLIFLLTIWPGIAIALLFSLLRSWEAVLSSISAGLIAAFVFFLFYMLALAIYKRRALGLGDIFLAALIGTMVGLPFLAVTLILGMMAGALGGLFLVAIRVRTRKDYIPYGAYLSFAAIIMVLRVS